MTPDNVTALYYSGGPLDEEEHLHAADHPLVTHGASIVIERQHARPRGALDPPVPRRGTYVRVGDLALWFGWDGDRPDLADPHG